MEIYGLIQDKIPKRDKSNKEYFTFVVDKKHINCFDTKVNAKFNIGDCVKLVTKTSPNGQFENFHSMELHDDKAPVEKIGNPPQPSQENTKAVEKALQEESHAVNDLIEVEEVEMRNHRATALTLATNHFLPNHLIS